MWHINQMELTVQRQRDLHHEAAQWRLAQAKDKHQPKRMIRRNTRKQNQ